ncbi:MAG: sodium/proline symporter [Bifidobacteriaceae bacterium]|jgi:sodium/proline symporter|nr:sodium/proline symporter [Bifidobacteriaceae bacterium]
MPFNLEVLVIFIIYGLIMVGIGIAGFRQVSTSGDYIIGSRSLGTFAAALSAEASDMSAWLFMGLPGAIYIAGSGKAWIALGLIIGTILNWSLIAKRIKKASYDAGDSVTIPGFFSNATKSNSKAASNALRVLTSIVIIIYFTIYTASGFVAGGKFFSYTFGFSYILSLCITAAIVIIYTFLGGFLSIAWNSVIQGSLMLFSVLIVPLSAFIILGGASGAFAAAPIAPDSNNMILEIISSLSWALGYFGMPHILIKYMAVKDGVKTSKPAALAISWCAISLGCAVLIGSVGRSFVGASTLNSVDAEKLFSIMIERVFIANQNMVLTAIGGLFLCAVLSAIMSTSASQLLMSSSSVSVDIYGAVIHGKLSDGAKLKISRAVVIAIALFGFIIALNPNNSVMDLVSSAWAGFGATFGPLVLLILFWKKVTAQGAILGMLTGAAVVFSWPLIPVLSALYSLLPAFILSTLVNFFASKQTSKSY